jgi:hypothetical protein
MNNNADTLENTAHTYGITDVEFEDRELILKTLASPKSEPKLLVQDFGDECFEEELSQINEGAFITAQMNNMVI